MTVRISRYERPPIERQIAHTGCAVREESKEDPISIHWGPKLCPIEHASHDPGGGTAQYDRVMNIRVIESNLLENLLARPPGIAQQGLLLLPADPQVETVVKSFTEQPAL